MRGRGAVEGRRKKLIGADGRLLWLLRLSHLLHATPAELEHRVTTADLALFQAWVEIDGPWWGEGERAILRQLCSVSAAVAGAKIPPDDFAPEWRVGPAGDEPAAHLLPPADGLEIFCARHGIKVETVP